MCWMIAIVVALPAVTSGCGGLAPVGVTGDVTFDGQPLAEGTVLFEPVVIDKGQRRDVAIQDGKFSLSESEGMSPGVEFKVIVKAFKKTGRKYPNADLTASVDEVVQFIPKQYNSASTLRVAISPDETENHFQFDLVSHPPNS